MKLTALVGAVLIGLPLTAFPLHADTIRREQIVRPLPGGLDSVPMVNDNNPELIQADGILLSTFPDGGTSSIGTELKGRFDLFSHHVYAGTEDSLDSTIWLGLLMAPLGDESVTVTLLEGSTSLSQATEEGQTAAPFLPLPALMRETTSVIAAGPGSRVAGDLIRRQTAAELAQCHWTLKPGAPTRLLQLPIPVQGLDPPAQWAKPSAALQQHGACRHCHPRCPWQGESTPQ